MPEWAVKIPSGQMNTYELEDDARDVVDLVRATDTPDCELWHLEDGGWQMVERFGKVPDA